MTPGTEVFLQAGQGVVRVQIISVKDGMAAVRGWRLAIGRVRALPDFRVEPLALLHPTREAAQAACDAALAQRRTP